MTEQQRKTVKSSDLSSADVDAALARIRARDPERAQMASHIYDALTWGDGPEVMSQAALQHWLWYELPTKYLTDEADYSTKMASTAAEFFIELGVDRYASICRDPITAQVFAAFDRGRKEGYAMLRKALAASGIEPPDTPSFEWSQVMGADEAAARRHAQIALEEAIASSELHLGGRGWQRRQQNLVDRALDADHPDAPGQTWRTLVLTERIGNWVADAGRSSAGLHQLRRSVANRLLSPLAPPSDAASHLQVLSWFLDRFGDEQPLTQAGYLNRAFVQMVYREMPRSRRFDPGRSPSSEADFFTLGNLREFLTATGALRKRGKVVARTKVGAAIAADPLSAWDLFVDHFAGDPWRNFVGEAHALLLIERGGSAESAELREQVARFARESGWQVRSQSSDAALPDHLIGRAFAELKDLLVLFGFLSESNDWRNFTVTLTPVGEAALLARLRHVAAGPRQSL